ncbi:MAG TPA: sigma 54-interacting transcriptional regulator [Polyangiaceae bacterium]|jgi:hypothetical protein|nr:sigma 54-interacting transcriptional regulator [Polyangiaceae bacterium]
MDPLTGTAVSEVASLRSTSASHAAATLTVLWCAEEPARVGETLLLPSAPGHTVLFGRGGARTSDDSPRVSLGRHEPNAVRATAPVLIAQLSRNQASLTPTRDGKIELRNVGQCRLIHNGIDCTVARVSPGDLVQFGRQLLFLCTPRPGVLPERSPRYPTHVHGAADAFGIVGESIEAWELRRQLALVAERSGDVLVRGASGSGKKLAAGAIRTMSRRGTRPIVCRNAIDDDVAARFAFQIVVPSLNERRADVPLIIAHLLSSRASTDGVLRARLYPSDDLTRPPRVPLSIVRRLVRHEYRDGVRELERVLLAALDVNADGLDAPESALRRSMSKHGIAAPRKVSGAA